jgi:helicase SWR1
MTRFNCLRTHQFHRAHRIGQIRDVHIYRFVSSHTVEEAMLLKANQKRSLDDLVIQKGEFDWRSLFGDETVLNKALDETALTKALGEVEDTEDAHAAAVAAREVVVMKGADEADFGVDGGDVESADVGISITPSIDQKDDGIISTTDGVAEDAEPEDEGDGDDEEGGTIVDYMLTFVRSDEEFFREWRL